MTDFLRPVAGEAPSTLQIENISSLNILKLSYMIVGLIIWFSYNAFLFSELSFKHVKFPFNDLLTIPDTNYK